MSSLLSGLLFVLAMLAQAFGAPLGFENQDTQAAGVTLGRLPDDDPDVLAVKAQQLPVKA